MASVEETKKPKLRDMQKSITLSLLKEAARTTFSRKNYEDVSMDDIAAEAGISRGTIYLHFSSKVDLLYAVLRDDLASQQSIYDDLAATPIRDQRGMRKWLQRFRDSLHERHSSLLLFPIALRDSPEGAQMVGTHREVAIEKLGKTYPGFNLSGLSGEQRKRKHARIYLMLFQMERICDTFSIYPGSPDIDVGLDLVAQQLVEFCFAE